MNIKLTCFAIFCCFFTGIFSARSQQVDSLLELYHDSFPEEKIHVHFDKGYYNPGETIWWKAYVLSGIEPSVYSRNLYAELIDEAGTVISRHTGPIIEAGSAGSFTLAANFNKDPVYFRAYTSNMLNGDTSFLYMKQIRVIVPVKTGPKPVLQASLKFFPEGGDWIAGLPTVLAFQATDQNGMPLKVGGSIRNKAGKTVAEFNTIHNGMGAIMLTAEKGESFTAAWKDPSGRENTTELPPVQPEGISLHMTPVEKGQAFTITRSEGVPESSKVLRVVATMNQRMLYSAKATLTSSNSKSGTLPTGELPSGIMQITIFDADMKPLAERVVFVNNREYEFDADVYLGVKNTGRRGLNKGEVVISDTMLANMSLSITDADLNSVSQFEDNIVSRFLLTGDLRGKIVNPYYYFFSTSDSASFQLNLVMLTHGWRRYNWPEVISGRFHPRKFRENNFLGIHGQLVGADQGKIAPGTFLTGIIQLKDSSKSFISLPVDRNGRVRNDGLIFYDQAKLYFQFSDAKRKFDKSNLSVDNGLMKATPYITWTPSDRLRLGGPDSVVWAKNLRLAADEAKVAVDRKRKTQVLQEVVVKAKVKSDQQKLDEKYTSGLFSGGDARSFDVANDPFGKSAFSVLQYLQGKVAGLQISSAGGNYTASWRGGTPVFYLDEMQSDISMVTSVNMNDVAYIKVFSPNASAAMSTNGGGAIAVYTKRGGESSGNSEVKGLDYLQIPGYTELKEFSGPDYATATPLDELPDLRTTLFWNPYIFLDKESRRFKFQFYNADNTKRFRIVLEGLSVEGKFVHIEKLIQ